MKPVRHLSVEAVRAIHSAALAVHGGMPGVRDERLLESAVAAAQATIGGQSVFSDRMEIAAAYLFYLSRSHAFFDGNKRTSLGACLVFLRLNGLLSDPRAPSASLEAWEALVLDIAASRLDREQTTARLRALVPGA